MDLTEYTVKHIIFCSWDWSQLETPTKPTKKSFNLKKLDLFRQLRQWINNIEIRQAQFAHRLCQLIPAQCPFERNITIKGKTLLRIPPLCKLNPLYEELVFLRFRALSYLADECGEDVSIYC